VACACGRETSQAVTDPEVDTDPGNIAAGATPIGAGFIQLSPPQVTGSILDAGGDVVVQATATCEDR